MGKRVNRVLLVMAALFITAGAAYGSVGSIISSFQVQSIYPPEMTMGTYRDASYVYIAVWDFISDYFYFYRYIPAGVFSGGVHFHYEWWEHPGWWGNSIKGTGYIAVSKTERDGYLLTFSIPSGYLVSEEYFEPGFCSYAYLPGSDFIFTGSLNVAHRRTTSGSLLASFPIKGQLCSVTAEFNGCNGEYLITEQGYPSYSAFVYTGDGSLVSSFGVLNPGKASACGPGYPASYGTTYWRFIKTAPDHGWCYQIDLGATTNVVPASLGKIKAIYR